MKISGRMISPGKARGEVLRIPEPLSFLGGVDGSTGEVRVGNGGNVAGKILVFPSGKGSTVGSFVMYDLMVHGKQPAAVINESAETIVATGAVISSIPMVDSVPSIDMFKDGDIVSLDANSGEIEIEGVQRRVCVSSAVVQDGKVLMLKRPERCYSFPGKWSFVAGKVEDGESLEEAARREILEETKISVGVPSKSLPAFYVREGKTLWEVHPFRFDVSGAAPVLDEENEDFRWVVPEEIPSMETVDGTSETISKLIRRSRPI